MARRPSPRTFPALKTTALRIAMLAPPWIEIPPPGYGGIEQVVDLLCRELVRRGQEVTLFSAPGSSSSATVHPVLDRPHPDAIGEALYEADHVALAFEAIDRAAAEGRPFDVVHDHCGFTALAMADRIATPVLHTLHGPFTDDISRFYARHGHKASIVAISQTQLAKAPGELAVRAVIPNPIDVASWPLQCRKDDYLLWIGRMTADKGPHRAIEVAQRAGRRLVLAGPIQPGQETFFETEVRPRLDGERVQFVGEVGGSHKQQLFAGASALLVPIRWSEPFGMVMIEALACGTPVLAFPEGAASEIVIQGENGFLVDDEGEMADAIARLGELDPSLCRRSTSRYAADGVAARYEAVYRELRSQGQPRDGNVDDPAGISRVEGVPQVMRRAGERRHVGTSTAAV